MNEKPAKTSPSGGFAGTPPSLDGSPLKWHVSLILTGLFFYFIGFHFLAFHLKGGFPQVELVVSLPPALKIGATHQMVVYAFQKGSQKPFTGLAMHVSLKTPRIEKDFVARFPLEENQPGQYIAGIPIGENMTAGDYLLNICPTEKPGMIICQVEAKVRNDLLLGVLPPEGRINAGESFTFHIAVMDTLKSLPLGGIPIRCKVKTADGIEIVNRLSKTLLNGTTEFVGYFHQLSKPGIYNFIFSSGNQREAFSIPVFPAISPSERFQNGVSGFFRGLVPFPMRNFLENDDGPEKLNLRDGSYPAKTEISLQVKGKSLFVSRPEKKRIEYSFMEVWSNNYLVAAKELGEVHTPFSLEVKRGIPKGYPLRVVFWKVENGKVASYEQMIPAFPHGKARGYFSRAAERLGISNGSFFNILYQGSGGGIVKPFIYQKQNDPDGTLRRVTILVYYILWILCGFQLCILLFREHPMFQYFRKDKENGGDGLPIYPRLAMFFEIASSLKFLKMPPVHLVISNEVKTSRFWQAFLNSITVFGTCLVLAFFYSVNLWFQPIGAGVVAFAGLMGFSLSLFAGFFIPDLQEKFKITQKVITAGLFLSFALVLAQGFEYSNKFYQWFDPLWLAVVLSLLYPPAFLASLGIARIPQIPGILARSIFGAFDGYFVFLSSRGWKWAGVQILLIFCIFYGIFIAFHQEDSLSSDIEEGDQGPVKMARTSLGSEIRTLSFEKSLEDIDAFSRENIPVTDFSGFPRTFGGFGVGVRSRFLLIKDLANISGSRIESLRVFPEYRDFLDRFIQRVQSFRYSYANLCQEAIARVERFPFLDRKKQKEEEKVLAGFLPSMIQILNLPDNPEKRIQSELKTAARYFIKRAANCISLDQTFLQSVIASEAGKNDRVNIKDWLGIQAEPGEEPQKGAKDAKTVEKERQFDGKQSQFLTMDQIRDVFRDGGTITLSGKGGKVNCSFLLTNEVLILNRGISFPQDFEAVNLEIRRTQPMVVELCM